MEPLTQADKKKILAKNPKATEALIAEYELLLVEKFANPRRDGQSNRDRVRMAARNKRISALSKILFLPDGNRRTKA